MPPLLPRNHLERLSSWLFTLALFILAAHFFIRLIDLSQLLFYYPFASETVTFLGQLHFLDRCGFHHYCPYWYDGFQSFLVTPPGWYFFTYPLFLLTRDVKVATYLSLLLLYAIGFLVIYYFGKKISLSPSNRIAFFLFFSGNNIAIKFILHTRAHELMAWITFIVLTFLAYHYKDRPLRTPFFLIIPFYSLTLLTHQSIGLFASIILFGLLLTKSWKERLPIIISILLSFLLVAFWIIPATLASARTIQSDYLGVETWWTYQKIHFSSIAIFLLPLLLFLAFFLYYQRSPTKQTTLLFFSPVLAVSFLFMTGILRFIPLFRNIFVYMYFIFLFFFILFFALQLPQRRVPLLRNTLFFLFAIALVTVSLAGTPFFQKPGPVEHAILDFAHTIQDPYIFVGKFPSTSFPEAYYGYFAIYQNKSAPLGGMVYHMKEKAYHDLYRIYKYPPTDCASFIQHSNQLHIRYFFGYHTTCDSFRTCNLRILNQRSNVCLATLD